MKKFIAFLLFTIVALVSIAVLLRLVNKPVIYKGISPRAQEYLSQNARKNSEPWGNFKIATKEAEQNGLIREVNDCFSILIPFNVLKNKEEGTCNRYITFASPRGEITVYQAQTSTSLDENPSIIMRRANSSMYNESSEEINGRWYLTFKEVANNYKKAAFYQANDQLFVLTINVYADDNLDKVFSQMLSSVVYK